MEEGGSVPQEVVVAGEGGIGVDEVGGAPELAAEARVDVGDVGTGSLGEVVETTIQFLEKTLELGPALREHRGVGGGGDGNDGDGIGDWSGRRNGERESGIKQDGDGVVVRGGRTDGCLRHVDPHAAHMTSICSSSNLVARKEDVRV